MAYQTGGEGGDVASRTGNREKETLPSQPSHPGVETVVFSGTPVTGALL